MSCLKQTNKKTTLIKTKEQTPEGTRGASCAGLVSAAVPAGPARAVAAAEAGLGFRAPGRHIGGGGGLMCFMSGEAKTRLSMFSCKTITLF